MLQIAGQLAAMTTTLQRSPEPTIEDLQNADMFIIYVEGNWLRARFNGQSILSTDEDSYEVFCIDFGFKQLVNVFSKFLPF